MLHRQLQQLHMWDRFFSESLELARGSAPRGSHFVNGTNKSISVHIRACACASASVQAWACACTCVLPPPPSVCVWRGRGRGGGLVYARGYSVPTRSIFQDVFILLTSLRKANSTTFWAQFKERQAPVPTLCLLMHSPPLLVLHYTSH